jgi:uncharacterized protein (DUF488 family)
LKLYTMGYQGRQLAKVIDLLRDQRVEQIIDVRRQPRSRRAGFSQPQLSATLHEKGFRYQSVPCLGPPDSLRRRLRATGDLGTYLDRYSDYLDTQSEALQELLHQAESSACCLLCYELDANLCHRKGLAERVASMNGSGFTILHL